MPGGGGVLALPHGEVGVLQDRFAEAVRAPVRLGGVQRGQFTDQHTDRPAVGDDVVLGQEQQVLVVGEPEQQGPGEGPSLRS